MDSIVPAGRTEKDCSCLTHEGPHYLHMDRFWRKQNQKMLEAAKKMAERPLHIGEQGQFYALLDCFAREEQMRLLEKARGAEAYER